jgi:hypothetical protein
MGIGEPCQVLQIPRFGYNTGIGDTPNQRTRQKAAFRYLRVVLSIFGLINFVWSSQAATYHVSPTGSDANPGTSSAPFLTIQKAANTVNPGDTVIVRDGTYSNVAATGVGSKLITMSRGGTASSWVTFMAEHTWRAVIDGLNNTTAEGWSFAASYIRVQGFEVKGFSDDAFSNYSGGQYLDIIGNHIHDMGRYCATTGIGRDGIFLGSDNVTVEQNVIHDIGRYAPGENGCTNSLYYQTDDHAIYVAGANNVMIRNNIFYRNQHGWSVHIYPNPVNNLSVLNNTFAIPNTWEPGYIILAAAVTNSRIDNNIFYQPNAVGVHFYNTSGYSNLAINNNLTYQGTIADATPSGVTRSSNKDNTNPLLANPSTYDFRLTSGSPAIGAGLTLAAVPDDYAGVARPQGNDIGAYAFADDLRTQLINTVLAELPPTLPFGIQVNGDATVMNADRWAYYYSRLRTPLSDAKMSQLLGNLGISTTQPQRSSRLITVDQFIAGLNEIGVS